MLLEYVSRLYKKLLLNVLNLLPNKFKEELFEYLIQRSEKLRRNAMRTFYSPFVMTTQRFDIDNLISAVNIAKKKFSSCKIYLITDHTAFYDLNGVKRIGSVEEVEELSGPKVFICAFESDQKLIKVLKKIDGMKQAFYVMPNVYYPTARYFHRNDLAKKVLTEEGRIKKPKFEISDFENLIQAIEITRDIEGDYLEIGVYQGRSAHLAMNYMNQANINRRCYFIDIFEGFNYQEAKDSADAIWAGTHTESSFFAVKEYLSEFNNVNIIKSNIITDNLPTSIKKIALCNIDVDIYEAVISAVKKVAPLISKMGLIILEDQGHTPALGGAYLAAHEFLNSQLSKDFIPIHMASGQMFLIKINDTMEYRF